MQSQHMFVHLDYSFLHYAIYINGFLYLFPIFFIFYRIHSTAGFCIQHEVKACIFTETTGIAQERVLFVIINGPGKFKTDNYNLNFSAILSVHLGSLYNIHSKANLNTQPLRTCTYDTDTHSLRSCHKLLGWQGQRRCSEDTAGSLKMPGSSHRNQRIRSSDWRPRWGEGGQSSLQFGLGSTAPS